MIVRLLVTVGVFALGCGAQHEISKAEPPVASPPVRPETGSAGLPAGPRLLATPGAVTFGRIPVGEVRTEWVTVANAGTAELVLSAIRLTGAPGFRFGYLDGDAKVYVPLGAPRVALPEPVALQPGESTAFEVDYVGLDDAESLGELRFFTNEAQPHAGVALHANPPATCIAVTPPELAFGTRLVGERVARKVTVSSCGTEPLLVTAIGVGAGALSQFAVDLGGAAAPSAALPLRLEAGEAATFDVVYAPTRESVGLGERMERERATVVIASNAVEDLVELDATGLATKAPAATAMGSIAEGTQVIPQTVLHLSAEGSFGAGTIKKVEWHVQQPPGSVSTFEPNAFATAPTFEANVAGEYVFSLHVWDQQGNKSLVPWTASVFVIPIDDIHVELLWNTPADEDQTDEGADAGSDVDLHFTHPYAEEWPEWDGVWVGPWFQMPYDCFWFNSQPNWWSFGNYDDDPRLDRDDTDGAGPENLNIASPQHGKTYRVGVHYWSDHGFGMSLVTVRFYIGGVLVAEMPDVPLKNHDMWCVATIDWPSGKVTPCVSSAGELDIIPNYQHPGFIPTE